MISLIWFIIVCYVIYRSVSQKGMLNGKRKDMGRPPQVDTTPVRHRAEDTNRPAYWQMPYPVQQQEPEQGSTMAYLNEKARQDEVEHAREKREETERLHRNYGGICVAERFFEGDALPQGKRCSVCDYCGAENLVPAASRKSYSCYFCREPLR